MNGKKSHPIPEIMDAVFGLETLFLIMALVLSLRLDPRASLASVEEREHLHLDRRRLIKLKESCGNRTLSSPQLSSILCQSTSA